MTHDIINRPRESMYPGEDLSQEAEPRLSTKSQNAFVTLISADTGIAAAPEIAVPAALFAVGLWSQALNKEKSVLPPAAADRGADVRSTKSKEEETIIISRSGRSTNPEEKS